MGRRWHSETLVCAFRGHVIPAARVRTLRPQDSGVGVDLEDGRRLARCTRCDAWVALAEPGAGAEAEFLPEIERLPLPRRGKALREAIILRLIAVDRAFHCLAFGAIAVGAFLAERNFGGFQAGLQRWLTFLSQGGTTGSLAHPLLAKELRHLLAVHSSSLKVVAASAAVYCLLEGTEAVGLWRERRWAEYLTAVATAGFLPFEIIELTKKVSPLKVVTLVINIAILIYLIYAKRLFGAGRLRKPKQDMDIEDVRRLFAPTATGTPSLR